MAVRTNGKRVRRLRQNTGLSQPKLIEITGLDENTIKKAERSERIAEKALARIARVLEVDVETLRADYISPETLLKLPLPPRIFLGRDEDLQELKNRLGVGRHQKKPDTPQVLTTLYGWPGVGKTALVSVLALAEDVRAHFSDGVLWTTLDRDPDIMRSLVSWGRVLGNDNISQAATLEEAAQMLRAMLVDKHILLIIDDVWNPIHAIPFQVGGENCATLITTRLPRVAADIAELPEAIYHLDVLTDDNALLLLRRLAPTVVDTYEDEARQLVQELEGLPLALRVAGRLLSTEAQRGPDYDVHTLLHDLREGKKLLEAEAPLERADPDTEVIPSVSILLQKSTDRLDPEMREYFALLAPFAPKPARFDLDDLKHQWRVEDPRPIINELVDRGLLEREESRLYWLHAVLVMHAYSLLDWRPSPEC